MAETLKYDVVVIGAGSAGIAAAVQSARRGMKTALLERLHYPGGKATAAEVRTLCGFYYSGRKKPEFIHNGFPKEFAEKMMALENRKPVSFDRDLYFIPYHPYSFKWLSDQFLQTGVDVYYQSYPVELSRSNDGNIDKLKVLNKDQVLTFETKMLIDCSGESVVSALLDIPQTREENYQAATQVFTLSKIDLPDNAMLNMLVNKAIIKAVQSGELPEYYDRLSVVPGSFKNGTASFKLSLPELLKDEMNSHSQLLVEARDRVGLLFLFLRDNIEAFKYAEFSSLAPELGIRTGRRLLGKYQLSKEDILHSARFEDAVAKGSWPIEKWGTEKRVSMSYPETGEYYEIPLRSLQSAHCGNLLAAGRGICADEDAIASARVIGTCMATGAASGIYAAEKINGKDDKSALESIRKSIF